MEPVFLRLALASVPAFGFGLGLAAEIEDCALVFFRVTLAGFPLRAAVALDRRTAGFFSGRGWEAAWGITSRSPASGASDSKRFAAAIASAGAPYLLPIIAKVSPLSTLWLRQAARRSGGTVCSEARSVFAVPCGTFT